MAPLFKRRKPAKPHFNLMTQAEYAENLEEGLANPHEYGSKMDGYSLNEMGGLVADKLRGNPVIDLACGSPNSVKRMFRLASVSGATCYKGTDINAWSNASYGVKIREFKEEMPMETYPRWEIYDKDMLTFLEGLPRTKRATVLFNEIYDAIKNPDEAGSSLFLSSEDLQETPAYLNHIFPI